METTFMTIHNITPDANILFASDSIVDVLGYHAEEVTGRSCFDYFHPNELPFARSVHNRGVQLDKAAVLNYARIRDRHGQWIGCECVFTVVYDVIVACTSIYRGDLKNERRAVEAPTVRRLFASSPRDPRYHMLEHLSSKFRTPIPEAPREPRAALILNRFTRTLTVMYATTAITDILGITPESFRNKSFYECIQENCLPEAIRCLESAKANDSIAYLRFWYRDPHRAEDQDQDMEGDSHSSDSEDGGVELHDQMDVDSASTRESSASNQIGQASSVDEQHHGARQSSNGNFGQSSGDSTDLDQIDSPAIFDQAQPSRSSSSSVIMVPPEDHRRARPAPAAAAAEPFEVEAVISCTSDGLVVILRRARPMIPSRQLPAAVPEFANGLFAAPWGVNPIRPHVYQPDPNYPFEHGFGAPQIPAGGPTVESFMHSIREVAVFAWSLVGINGNIASYGRGTPVGEAQPLDGLPIWDPYSQPEPGYLGPENQAAHMWARMGNGSNVRGYDIKEPYSHQGISRRAIHQNAGNGLGSQAPNSSVQGQIAGPTAPESNTNTLPTNMPQGPSEGSRGNRYLWF